MILLFVIFLIILAMENSKLKKENVELKRRLGMQGPTYSNVPVKDTAPQEKKEENVLVSAPVQQVSFGGVNQFNAVSSKPSNSVNKQQSNSGSLFIVGAILIVIAALIFIGSTWDLIPGLIKTIILVGFQLFFHMMSNVCKEKYKLEKTSDLFFYLVMLFVPIVLLSLGIFRVVGPYFSVGGEGFLLYVGFMFLLSDVVYKVIPTSRKHVRKFGVVSEVLAILYVVSYFNLEFINMMFVLAIYTVIVFLLLQGNYLKKEDYMIINSILFYGTMVLFIVSIGEDNVFANLGLLIYAFWCFGKLFIKGEDKLFHLILGIVCYSFGLEMICDLVNNSYYFLCLLMLLPLYSLYFVLDEDREKLTLCWMVCVISSGFMMVNHFTLNQDYLWCLSYVLLFSHYVLSFVCTRKHVFKYFSYFGIFMVLGTIFTVNELVEFIRYIPLGLILVIYGLEYLFKNLKDKASGPILLSILIVESMVFIHNYSVLIPLVMAIGLVYLEKESEWYLLVPILCGFSVFYIGDSSILGLLSLCVIVLLSGLSMMKRKINVYSIASFLTMFMSIGVVHYDGLLFSFLVFVWGVGHLLVNRESMSVLYKLVTVFSGLGLYICFLNKIGIELTSIYSIGYFGTLFCITRFIMKENDFRDFFEYFGFLMVAVPCMILMKGEIDGFIEVFILFALSLVSYKKYHPYFVMSVIFIVIYVLIETAEFLFMIPWYVYVLLIGFTFIMMGTREENKKKKKANLEKNPIDDLSLMKKEVSHLEDEEEHKTDEQEMVDVELPIVKDSEKK